MKRKISASIILSICLIFSIININVLADDEIVSGTKKYFIGNNNYTADWTYNFNTGVLTLSGEGILWFNTEDIRFYKKVNGLSVRDDEKTERFYNGCKTLIVNGFSEITTINVGNTVNLETIYLPKELVRMTESYYDAPIGFYAGDVFQGKYNHGSYAKPQNLKAFIVDPENPAYKSVDGVLYTKEGAFLEYPYGKTDESFTVPKDICQYNGRWIQIRGQYLKKVIVPEEVGNFEFATTADLYLYSKSAYGYGDTVYMYKDSEAYKEAYDSIINRGNFEKIKIIDGKLDESGTYGSNINWQYDDSSKTLTISGVGAMEDRGVEDYEYPYWRFYYNEIESIIIETGISHIGSNAFYNNHKLISVIIPKSVKSIGYWAFLGSDSVTDIYYEGTQKEWNDIDYDSIDDDLPNATIHYNYNMNKDFDNVVFSNKSYSYDGMEKSISVSGNLPEGAKVTYTNNKATNAGTYNATAKVTCDGYNDLTLTATLTIEKAQISVKANDIQVVKDANIPSLTYTITSGKLFGKDELTGALNTNAITSSIGSYDITQGSLKATSNYNLTFTKGILSVVDKTPQNITVGKIENKVYGDDAFTLAVTPDTESGLAEFTFESSNPDVAVVDSNGTITIKGKGETQITVKQAGNDEYAPFEYTQTLVVAQKGISILSIDLDNETAEFDGISESDKDGVELDFDKLDKTFSEVEEIESVKKAKMTAKNFVLKGDKAENYFVATESIIAYAGVEEVDNEKLDTTEGVTADVVKTEDIAIISNVDISAVGEDEENIVFDLTKDTNISAVSITAEALQQAAAAEKGYQIKTTDKNNKEVSFIFDKDALGAISEDVTGNISIKADSSEFEGTALNESRKTELASKSATVYELSLENAKTTNFGEGKATVGLYYEKPAIEGNVIAGYIKPDGTIESVPSAYDDATKTVTLTLSHFSGYVIYTEPTIKYVGSSGGGVSTSYTVKLDTNGGDELKDIKVKKGQSIGTIAVPTKKGYIFDGWYSDKKLTKEYSADDKITEETTLYAGWKVDPIRQMTLTIGDKNATVFGKTAENDVAPIIRNDRTMLPIRFIAEALGATVNWDSESRTVVITSDDTEIRITIDETVATVNGKEISLDSPAFIESDRTFLPLRFVSENLGAEVEWLSDTKQVVITKPIEE